MTDPSSARSKMDHEIRPKSLITRKEYTVRRQKKIMEWNKSLTAHMKSLSSLFYLATLMSAETSWETYILWRATNLRGYELLTCYFSKMLPILITFLIFNCFRTNISKQSFFVYFPYSWVRKISFYGNWEGPILMKGTAPDQLGIHYWF